MSRLSTTLMGKKHYTLTYDYKDHSKISNWLVNAANITELDDINFDE